MRQLTGAPAHARTVAGRQLDAATIERLRAQGEVMKLGDTVLEVAAADGSLVV